MHSHSATTTFNNCPFKLRQKELGYRAQALDAKSNKRVWGIAAHAGMRVLYTGGTVTDALKAFLELYPENLDQSDKVWSKKGAAQVFTAYVARWGQDSEWEVLESEFHNPEDEREDEGHLVIDLVMKHRASGSIYFWDHKFKTKWDGSGKAYELDAQLSRYAAYVRDKWGDCAGALVNVIVPHYRERKWKDRPAGWDIQFDRKMYSRTTDQIEAWRRSQGDWEAVMGACKESGVYPRHYGSLCAWCEFYDGCYAEAHGSGPEIWETLYRPGVVADECVIEIEEG